MNLIDLKRFQGGCSGIFKKGMKVCAISAVNFHYSLPSLCSVDPDIVDFLPVPKTWDVPIANKPKNIGKKWTKS